MLVGVGHPLAAQDGPLTQMASVEGAVVRGVVTDGAGRPLEGAMVSALGAAMTALAVTDGVGRYELTDLLAGPYLLRAHLSGFSASGRNFIEVSHAAEIEQAFALSGLPDGIAAEPEVLAAGILTAGQGDAVPAVPGTPGAMTGDEDNDTTGHDHSELAWRLRHVRRSVLREANELARVESSQQDSSFLPGTLSFFGRAMESSARMASSFFSGAPFAGEINLLTSGSIEQVGDLLSSDFGPRGRGLRRARRARQRSRSVVGAGGHDAQRRLVVDSGRGPTLTTWPTITASISACRTALSGTTVATRRRLPRCAPIAAP